MSSSPTLIMIPTSGEEEEEMLAIDRGRSHTPPPRSRPNSRLEILIMDMARSTEQRLENLARAQSEQSKSTKEQIEERFESFARAQSEQSKSTKEQIEERFESFARAQSEQSKFTKVQIEERFESFARAQSEQLAHMTGRLSSLEVSRHGTPSPSPNPGRRGSPSSAETMHVSVPSADGDLVP